MKQREFYYEFDKEIDLWVIYCYSFVNFERTFISEHEEESSAKIHCAYLNTWFTL